MVDVVLNILEIGDALTGAAGDVVSAARRRGTKLSREVEEVVEIASKLMENRADEELSGRSLRRLASLLERLNTQFPDGPPKGVHWIERRRYRSLQDEIQDEARSLKQRVLLQGLLDSRSDAQQASDQVHDAPRVLKTAWGRSLWLASAPKGSVVMIEEVQVQLLTSCEQLRQSTDAPEFHLDPEDVIIAFRNNVVNKSGKIKLASFARLTNRHESLHAMIVALASETRLAMELIQAQERDVKVRTKRIHQLAALNNRYSNRMLIELIADDNEETYARVSAVHALAKLGPDALAPEYKDALLGLLSTASSDRKADRFYGQSVTNRFVREAVALALGLLHYQPGLEQLVDLMENEVIKEVRFAARDALALFPDATTDLLDFRRSEEMSAQLEAMLSPARH